MRIFAYSVREDEVKYFERFREVPGVELNYTTQYPDADNLELARGCDAVSIITNVITPDMYRQWNAMGVRYLATRSVGFDHLNTGLMRELGMRGVHASYSPNAVANYTIMLMLMACRNMCYILDTARLQDFSLPGKIGRELSLSTVGIIGTGQIGETVIRHLSGFGCRILCCDMYEKDSVKQFAEYTDLDTIYRECDIISIHVPGFESNRHMIGREAFAKMQDGVILINAARGMLVDSEALVEGLENGKIAFAALDTFEEEFGLYYRDLRRQQPANRMLRILQAMPNVILSPHMAFYTEQSTSDMVATTMNGLLAFAKDAPNPAEISYE